MKTTVLLALLIAVVGRFLADEVKAWSGWLHKKIRRTAVKRLPAELRERYDEEWESALEEIPGELLKVVHSIGLLRASIGISRAAPNNTVKIGRYFDPLKRLFDITFSAVLLAVIAPTFLLIAVAIKLESRGPIFYREERIGKKGRTFYCMKFRTISTYEIEYGRLFKATNDRRITRLGQFLRRSSLDELPQLFNVLSGDMSIVGPRPPIAREVSEFDLDDFGRLDVPPGLTGLAQVQRLQDPSSECDKAHDVTYVTNRSFWLDFKIIVRTVGLAIFWISSDSDKDAHNPTNKDD
jgi:lipopolysaccharide/colanic/teichoic acid biosynthesis glycosyltransferase